MKIKQIYELKDHITTKDLANLFSVESDEKLDNSNKKVYNIMRSLFFDELDNIPVDYFSYYTIVINDTWPLISHKLYNSTELWWILIKLNNIKNPFIDPDVSKQIRYISKDTVRGILNTIREN